MADAKQDPAVAAELDTISATQVVGYDSSQFEWETVHTEAPDQILFESPGDTYIGLYVGWDLIYPDPENPNAEKANAWFVQLHFTDPSGSKVINTGFDLRRAFLDHTNYREWVRDSAVKPEFTEKIAPQSVTRIQYAKDVDVDQNDPMRSFRVDVAKAAIHADNSGQ